MRQGSWPGLKPERGIRALWVSCHELHPYTQQFLQTSSRPQLVLKGKNSTTLAEVKCENSRGPQLHPGVLGQGKSWQAVLLSLSPVSPDPTGSLQSNSKALMAHLPPPGRLLL